MTRGLLMSLAVWTACLLLPGAAGLVQACDTPVYRYAMYRWNPAAYEVYGFFEDQPKPEMEAVGAEIRRLADAKEAPANFTWIPVNLSDDPNLETVPADVRAAWERTDPKPNYLVFSPQGREVFAGNLTVAQVGEIADSPARKAICQQLAAGKTGVLVLLSGADAGRTAEVEKDAKKLIADLVSGETSLVPPIPGAGDLGALEAAEDEEQLDVGFVRVNRDDSQEQWLVRQLLASEEELASSSEPMVFVMYGRGRVQLPYIGDGITYENLKTPIQFCTGDCSCTVKEQNPGFDIIARHDWDAAAAAMVEKFGREEGADPEMDSLALLPSIIDTGTVIKPLESGGEGESTESTANDGGSEASPPEDHDSAGETAEKPAPGASHDPPAQEAADEQVSAAKGQDGKQVASTASAVRSGEQPEDEDAGVSSAFWWILSGIVVVGLVGLFAATFLVLRPR